MDFSYIKMPKGVKMRDPYQSEIDYFRANPSVSGMATSDNKVILNPFSSLSGKEFQAVAINESARILMRQQKNKPTFDLTEQQKANLDATIYRNASEDDKRATIAARILSGDPSGGMPSSEQIIFINMLKKQLDIGE